MKKYISLFIGLLVFIGFSQEKYIGDGPYKQLIIRGVTLINGDGSPPKGPRLKSLNMKSQVANLQVNSFDDSWEHGLLKEMQFYTYNFH